MATQFFSDEQMERLRSYPDIGREELIRLFTLTRKDLGFVDNLGHGGGRGPAARLRLAVQLSVGAAGRGAAAGESAGGVPRRPGAVRA